MRETESRPGSPKSRGIVFNFLSLLLGSFGVELITIAYLLYAARIVGPEGYGEFSYILAIMAISSVFFRLGLPLVVMREAAVSSRDDAHRVVQTAILLTLLLTVAGCLLIGSGGWFIPRLRANYSYLVLAMVSTAITVEDALINSYLKGRKLMAVASVIEIAQAACKAVVGVALLWCGFQVASFFWALIASSIFALVLYAWVYRRDVGYWPVPATRSNKKTLFKEGAQIAAAHLTSAAFNRFDWVFLGSLKARAVLGVYSAGYRFYEILMRVSGVMAVSVYPSICQSEKRGGDNRQLLRLALKVAVLPGCLFLVYLLYWAETLIVLTLDARFLQAVPILIVLCVSLPFQGICGILYHIAVARKRQRYLVWSSGASASTNILLCLCLIPLWGGLGAALAMVPPVILQCLLLARVAQVSFRDLWIIIVYVVWSVLMIGAIVSSVYYFLPVPWPVQIILSGLLLIPALWFASGLDAVEKRILSQALRRLFNWSPPDMAVGTDAMKR
ncbi:MAG: oligosaccharide flippase family protein [Phycisphaerae bacterium]|nr:oligosaccharide flippase family protein [Phycisphaerae bacterium]